jgi:hypothetical protein
VGLIEAMEQYQIKLIFGIYFWDDQYVSLNTFSPGISEIFDIPPLKSE